MGTQFKVTLHMKIDGDEHMVMLMLSETVVAIENIIRRNLNNFQNTKNIFLRAALFYCSCFGAFKNLVLVEEFRRLAAEWSRSYKIFLTKKEICSLGNLLPTTANEAKVLIESLKRVNDDDLQILLGVVENLV